MESCTTAKSTATAKLPISDHNYNINVVSKIVEIDNLGRLYILDTKNKITNYKTDLTKAFEYANRRGGTISSIDVTNPLQIIAFSDDFNQAYILDNTLTLIKTIPLAENFVDITACSSSNDGNYWVFEPTLFRLIKINDAGTKIVESSNINDFGMAGVKITDIRERGNYVVLCDRNRGFFIFDNMGQYVSRYEETGIKSFQFDGDMIYYSTSSGLKMYDIKAKERRMIGSPPVDDFSKLHYVLYQNRTYVQVFSDGLNLKK